MESTRRQDTPIQIVDVRPQNQNKRILCVDDSPYNLFVLQELIRSAVDGNVEIDTALNGQLALECIEKTVKEQGKPMYDFMFLDLMMPVLDGFQVNFPELSYFVDLRAAPPAPIGG